MTLWSLSEKAVLVTFVRAPADSTSWLRATWTDILTRATLSSTCQMSQETDLPIVAIIVLWYLVLLFGLITLRVTRRQLGGTQITQWIMYCSDT